MAEAYEEGYVALISLPGLDSTPMIKRVREAILQLVNEMYYGSSKEERGRAEQRIQSKDDMIINIKNYKIKALQD